MRLQKCLAIVPWKSLRWIAASVALLMYSVCAQETIRVGLLPMAATGDSLSNALEEALPRRIQEALNRLSSLDVEAHLISADMLRESLGRSDGAKQSDLLGLISVEILAGYAQIDSSNDYLVEMRTWAHESKVNAEIVVLTGKSLKSVYDVVVSAPEAEVFSDSDVQSRYSLLGQIVGHLEIALGKNIRIATLPFEMVRGDSSRYGFLEKSFPTMILTDLKVLSRGSLLTANSDTLLQMLVEQRRLADSFRPEVGAEFARMLNANYVIMGEFWELDNTIRLDVRCVSVETAEVIATEKMVIEEPNGSKIDQQIGELAAHLRSAIEEHYVRRAGRPRTIAVTAFPPSPNSEATRQMLLEMVRATSRKLTSFSSLRVMENIDAVRRFVGKRTGRWGMSFELGTDLLMTLDLDATDMENLVLNADVFDTRDPERLMTVGTSESFSISDIEDQLNAIVMNLKRVKGVSDEEFRKAKVEGSHYRGLYQPLSLGLSVGYVTSRASRSLFLDGFGSPTIEFGVTWTPASISKLQIDLLKFRVDLGTIRTDRRVVGLDVSATCRYKFQPFYARSFFVEGSLGALGIYRKASTDAQYDARLGIGLGVGYEQFLNDLWCIVVTLKYNFAFDEIPAHTLGGLQFEGGRPGTLLLMVGVRLNL